MAREDGRIMALWGREYGMAQGILDRVRECSGLSKSWILPPIGQVETRSLPTCYQNMGSRGTTNLEGKYLFSMYPYGLPWLNLDLAEGGLHGRRPDAGERQARGDDRRSGRGQSCPSCLQRLALHIEVRHRCSFPPVPPR